MKRILIILTSLALASCSAYFGGEPTYTFREAIVVVTDSTGGSIEIPDDGGISVDEGDGLTLSVDGLDPSFSISWMVDGVEVAETAADESYTVTPPPGTHVVTAIVKGEGENDIGSVTVTVTVEHEEGPAVVPAGCMEEESHA